MILLILVWPVSIAVWILVELAAESRDRREREYERRIQARIDQNKRTLDLVELEDRLFCEDHGIAF